MEAQHICQHLLINLVDLINEEIKDTYNTSEDVENNKQTAAHFLATQLLLPHQMECILIKITLSWQTILIGNYIVLAILIM